MARTIAKDHDQKRAQILKSAARVFAMEGFDRASMTQLARECGISKANIYHYYDSKDAILFDLLDSYLSALRDRICDLPLQDLNPPARLTRLIEEVLRAYQGADDEHKVQISAMTALGPDQQKQLRGYQRELVGVMSAALQANAPQVFAADPTKLRAAAMSVFGMLNWYFMWNAGACPAARDDYARSVARLTLGGLNGL